MKNTVHPLHWAGTLVSWLALTACATSGTQGPAPALLQPVPHAASAVASLPAPSALELQTGIQIAHVGLTASGGLVDLRFKVLDTAKATALLGNPAHAPMLIAGDLPPLMAPHKALHGARYGQGQLVYILYPNLRGAIQPGSAVLVAIGDVRLGPVTAQ